MRLRLARHPRTPRRFAIALLRQLYLFDLVRLSLLPSAPAEIRRVAEELMVSRVPQLPIGQKLTLARRGPARVVGALLAEGHPQAIKLALANAFLTESQVLKVLTKPGVAGTSRRRHRSTSTLGSPVQYPCRVDSKSAHARSGDFGVSTESHFARLEGLGIAGRPVTARAALYSEGAVAPARCGFAARSVGN